MCLGNAPSTDDAIGSRRRIAFGDCLGGARSSRPYSPVQTEVALCSIFARQVTILSDYESPITRAGRPGERRGEGTLEGRLGMESKQTSKKSKPNVLIAKTRITGKR